MAEDQNVPVQPLLNSQAFSRYHELFLVKLRSEETLQLIEDTKMHLSALGWTFFTRDGTLRYRSPIGFMFNSLSEACFYAFSQRKGGAINNNGGCDTCNVPHALNRCPACFCIFCSDDQPTLLDNPKFRCSQCQRLFHRPCRVPQRPPKDSFCSSSCHSLYGSLKTFSNRLHGIPGSPYEWGIWKIYNEDFQPLVQEHTRMKLQAAYTVFEHFFGQIRHTWANQDLIRDMISGNNLINPNLRGFCTAILQEQGNEQLLSAILIRVHDSRMAEIPFVATRSGFHGQGFCRRLLGHLKVALADLGVEQIVLSSAHERVPTWTNLGFSPITPAESQLIARYNSAATVMRCPLRRF